MTSAFAAFRATFYLLLPSETYFERLEDVPDYVVKVIEQCQRSVTLALIVGHSTLSRFTIAGVSRRLVSGNDEATFQ
jgi:hypothetical protein